MRERARLDRHAAYVNIRTRLVEQGLFRSQEEDTTHLFLERFLEKLPYTSSEGAVSPLGAVLALAQTHYETGHTFDDIYQFHKHYFPKIAQALFGHEDPEIAKQEKEKALQYQEELMNILSLADVAKMRRWSSLSSSLFTF